MAALVLVSRDGVAVAECHLCGERVILLPARGWTHGRLGDFDHQALPEIGTLPGLGGIA